MKGELCHEGQEWGKAVRPFEGLRLALSEIVGTILGETWVKWLQDPYC